MLSFAFLLSIVFLMCSRGYRGLGGGVREVGNHPTSADGKMRRTGANFYPSEADFVI